LPNETAKATPKGLARQKKPKGDSRLTGGYLRVPTAITRANDLSPNAKSVALAIRQATNFGPWNRDLYVDLTTAELVKRANVGSYSTVQRAVRELEDGRYLKKADLNRGGLRYWLLTDE
jgi:hypothetical protein